MTTGGSVAGASLLPLLLLVCFPPAHPHTTGENPVAAVLREVTAQLERFNALYISKLERALSESSARLAAVEATVRGVADRAAAWDNIQNHMAVWTDQSRTMERKLDILNRCHEKQESWESRLSAVDALNHKLIALDKKINAMTRLEFKVEQVSERVEEVDSTINWVKKQMNSAEQQPIIAEFAGRGVLSSLVQIEAKLDNLTQQTGAQDAAAGYHGTAYKRHRVYGGRGRGTRPTVEPEPGIAFTQAAFDEPGLCQLHPRDSRRLQDVGAKVDLVFDRLTDPDYDYDDHPLSHLHQRAAPNTQYTDGEGEEGEEGDEDGDHNPEVLFARFWRSVFTPFKKLKRRFKGFENQLTAVHRSCNESGGGTEGGDEVARAVVVLQQSVNEGLSATRDALTTNTAAVNKLSQEVSRQGQAEKQVVGQVQEEGTALRVTLRDGLNEVRNTVFQYCTAAHPPARNDPTPPPTPPYHRPTSSPFPRGEQEGEEEYTTVGSEEQLDDTHTGGDISADCARLRQQGVTRTGLYGGPAHAYHYDTRLCDQTTAGGGWTVVQRRGMFGPPYLNFTRSWHEYKTGFGELSREFWWGNDNIHRLTSEQEMIIRFDLWDFEGNYAYAEYISFSLGSEAEQYRVSVYGYRGNASDSFSAHNGHLFSTYDRDNDKAPECCPCAPAYGGGWWFYSCFESNLNGDYHTEPRDNEYYRGIIWELWLGDYSLRATEIKMRPAQLHDRSPPPPPPTTAPPHAPTLDPNIPELPLRHPLSRL